jgi:hypothetical protein
MDVRQFIAPREALLTDGRLVEFEELEVHERPGVGRRARRIVVVGAGPTMLMPSAKQYPFNRRAQIAPPKRAARLFNVLPRRRANRRYRPEPRE